MTALTAEAKPEFARLHRYSELERVGVFRKRFFSQRLAASF